MKTEDVIKKRNLCKKYPTPIAADHLAIAKILRADINLKRHQLHHAYEENQGDSQVMAPPAEMLQPLF